MVEPRFLRLAIACCVVLSACRQDMHDAPRYDPLEESDFFSDGRSARSPVPNTVARGLLRDDELLYTGLTNGQLANQFPMPVTAQVMSRGQERFNIYCSPCHGRTGRGDGMVVRAASGRRPRSTASGCAKRPSGYFYDVISNGFGAMSDYSAQVPVADRWAIVAYVKALQLSQHATIDEVPADRRAELK